jgi:alkyldihydroxyacetonephosphate synthase
MAHTYKDFEPPWYRGEVPEKSYRSIFKWGKPETIKTPRESLYKLMKAQFGLGDEDFKDYSENLGLEEVRFDAPIRLTGSQLSRFEDIVGKGFVRTDDYARLSVAYGKTMYDLMRIRNRIIENIPYAVLYPDTKEQIEAIVALCAAEKIPLYV